MFLTLTTWRRFNKALYISEHDERTKYIHDKIGGISSIISIAILAIASIMAGFYSVTVFFSLFGALLVVALVRGGLKLYYRRSI